MGGELAQPGAVRGPEHVDDVIRPDNPPDAKDAYSLLVEMATEYAMYTLSPDGIVSTWTLGAERMKGYRPEEIIGQHFSVFYRPQDREAGVPERTLEQARVTGRAEVEGWRVRKDGSEFWARVLVAALRSNDGRLRGYAKLTRDETERRAAEVLSREVDRISAREKIASALASTVVHELFSVGLQLSSAMKTITDQNARLKIQQASERLDGVIRDVRKTAFDMSVVGREDG